MYNPSNRPTYPPQQPPYNSRGPQAPPGSGYPPPQNPGAYGTSNPGPNAGYPPPFSSQGGYNPHTSQSGYNPGNTPAGYPPQSANAGYPPQTNPYGSNNPPPMPNAVQGQWYSRYYSQLSQPELAQLRTWFQKVDTDRSGTIEAEELQQVAFDNVPLGIVVAQKLVQVFDRDRNGRIDFDEYASMHKFLSHMRAAFLMADTDHSGRIEAPEILNALNGAGWTFLTMPTITELMRKFDKTRKGLDWREFLLMLSHIANVHSVFSWNDSYRRGTISLNEDQLLHISAYLI